MGNLYSKQREPLVVMAHVIKYCAAPVQKIGFWVFSDLVRTRGLLGRGTGTWTWP